MIKVKRIRIIVVKLVNDTRKKNESMLFYIASNCNCIPAGIYLFKVNNRNTRTKCEICSQLTIKTPE